MTKAEAAFLRRVKRRAATLEPKLARAFTRDMEALARSLPPGTLERVIREGRLERFLSERLSPEQIRAAFADYQRVALDAVQQATEQMAREIATTTAIRFNVLNPRVIDAVKQLNDRMMRGLSDGIRETVREQVRDGIEAGINPRQVARHLDIALAPNQAAAVENYRAALAAGNAAKARSYKLRDARFDRTVAKGNLSPAQIEKMTDAYARRMRAFNAETQARSAALDAERLGQRLSIEDAIDKGIYDRTRLFKRWVTAGDDRVRDEHREVNGETVPFDEEFSTGEMIPGESTYNCRCVARYFESDPALVARSEEARKAAWAKQEEAVAA